MSSRPPEPHMLAALVFYAARVLPWYQRPRLWPRASQSRRSMSAYGSLKVPSRHVRELCMRGVWKVYASSTDVEFNA